MAFQWPANRVYDDFSAGIGRPLGLSSPEKVCGCDVSSSDGCPAWPGLRDPVRLRAEAECVGDAGTGGEASRDFGGLADAEAGEDPAVFFGGATRARCSL